VPRERWDEWLVLGSGWLYKQDLKIEQLRKQQHAVAQYLDTINEVLFYGTKCGVRGWASEKERVEKREREARGKACKSSVPFPEMDSIASESAMEAVGSGDSARQVESADMLNTLQDLSITEEPEALQTLAEDHDDYADRPSVHDDDLPRWHSAVRSRTVNSCAPTCSLSRSFPPPFCPTYPHHQIGPTC